jgi:hypothetical protein
LLTPDLSALLPANSKENAAKEEMGMTLLICLAYSDTNPGRGRRYPSYGRNTFSFDRCLFMGDPRAFHLRI